jgi:antitoxin YefM
MKRLNYSVFEPEPKQSVNEVCDTSLHLLIKRPDVEPAVLMSLRESRSIEETMYLMQSPRNAARLLSSIKELDAGRGIIRKFPIDQAN